MARDSRASSQADRLSATDSKQYRTGSGSRAMNTATKKGVMRYSASGRALSAHSSQYGRGQSGGRRAHSSMNHTAGLQFAAVNPINTSTSK